MFIGFRGIPQKITRTLFFTQSIVSAGFITTATVNSIVGAELSGKSTWAGMPATVFLISSALGSLSWGLLMERIGRRSGLTLGLVIGAGGGLLSGLAVWQESIVLFLVGMALLGLGMSAMMLGRFAAAEVHTPKNRGKAIANVVLGGTVGSIVGPLLVAPAGVLAGNLGFAELVGPYGTSFILLMIGATVIFTWLRPDPMQYAKELSNDEENLDRSEIKVDPISEILKRRGVQVAILSMVFGQAVMVMIMVITSLHMKALGHPLSSISLVISAHTFGMYAFSVFSGRLADRIGKETVILIGGLFLIISGVTADISTQVLPISISLFSLGLGWNLCYVGGSALLTDHLSHGEQSRMQGVNDLLVGLSSAVASLSSGFVFVAVGFQIMGFIGAGFAIIPLIAGLLWRIRINTNKPAAVV
jgi:MFS family permease